ncbi:MAG: hypothetical protein IKU10_06435 [Clostridia bacterium]|nr:hypothetical protein [Clostridia bacterium]
MNKGTTGFLKGIGTGMAMGIVASVAGTMVYQNNKKTFRKTAKKAVKTVTGLMDDMQSMMR